MPLRFALAKLRTGQRAVGEIGAAELLPGKIPVRQVVSAQANPVQVRWE